MTEATFLNRSGWDSGPWDGEPDRIYWIDAATGLPCLIRRNHSGHLCGYVAVLPGHPWHGKGYSECVAGCEQSREWSYCDHSPGSVVSVHGGLTYADACDGDKAEGICHVPEPGSPDDAWWFGFDCHHGGDVSPRYGASLPGSVYRTVEYVRAETASLVAQIAAVAG